MTRAFLLGLVLLTTACGKKTFDSLCATQVPAPAACNTPCDPAPGAPSACPNTYHCSADGKCDLFCTPAGGECGDGYSCTADGYCVSNGDDDPIIDGEDCPAVHLTGTKKTPTVELLLDQSGSMTAEYGTGANPPSRWVALRKALVDPTNGVVKQLAGSVVFGATLYTGVTNDCPKTVSTARSLNNFNAIQQLLTATPASNTPTARSIDRVVASFAANPPAPDSPPIILLATDGLPDTCENENPDTDAEQEAANQTSVAAAQRAYAAGIKLYFLFIGDVAVDHPQQMANAGVGKAPINPAGGNAPFYLANNPAALTAAFNTIIGNVVSCDLQLSSHVPEADGPSGTVVVNGMTLTYGTDWTLDADGNTIHVVGAACTALKNAANPTVDATFPCGTIIF